MKKILMILTVLTSFSSFANTLNCAAPLYISSTEQSNDLTNYHAGIYGSLYSDDCEDNEGNRFEIEIMGVGVGLDISAYEEFVFSCPNLKELEGSYMGARLKATVVFGLNLGVFKKKNKKTFCILGGSALGLGAAVQFGSRVSVRKI